MLPAVVGLLLGGVIGFYACIGFRVGNLAMLRNKYETFYETSPEQLRIMELQLYLADRTLYKTKGRDLEPLAETWKSQQQFLRELEAATGSNSLYYYDTKQRPSSSGFLVVSSCGKVVKDIDFTVISRQ